MSCMRSGRLLLMWRLVVALGLTVSGCGKRSVEHTEESDRLHMCVDPPSRPQYPAGAAQVARYLPDQPVTVEVLHRGCLSASCSTDRAASCTVSRSGGTLTVRANLSWTQETGGPCTADYDSLRVMCSSEPLPAGTYSVVFGEHTTTLTVATSSTARPCVHPSKD